MKPLPTFAAFQAEALQAGYDEVLERQWPPGEKLDTHTHPFALKAIVVKGEMWLSNGEQTLHLLPGDTFSLAYEAPHAERYGDAGATYWVARRNQR